MGIRVMHHQNRQRAPEDGQVLEWSGPSCSNPSSGNGWPGRPRPVRVSAAGNSRRTPAPSWPKHADPVRRLGTTRPVAGTNRQTRAAGDDDAEPGPTMVRAAVLLAVFLLVASGDAHGQRQLSLDVHGGTAWNAPTRLTIEQDGLAPLRVDARWQTHGLQPPLYYAVRLGLRDERSAWELHLVHHKLYLRDPPPGIERFEITHGFNLLMVGYAALRLPVELRIAGGVVFPHVDGDVRGTEIESSGGILGTGYRVAGPALLMGIGQRWPLTGRWSVGGALDGIAGWVRSEVAGGRVETSSLALHGHLGLGYTF